VPESSLQETAELTLSPEGEGDGLEAVETDPQEIPFREEPFLKKPEEDKRGNEYLEQEPVIDLLEPELQVNDALGNTSLAGTDQTVQREETTTPPVAPINEMSSPELKAEEGKRTCPRCSLKFNLNVKQCPICKVSLLSEGGEQDALASEQEPAGMQLHRVKHLSPREQPNLLRSTMTTSTERI
jgi:hypothetical protein